MSNDLREDYQDIQDIKRQKEELKKSQDNLSTWEYGQGLKQDKESQSNVQSSIQ